MSVRVLAALLSASLAAVAAWLILSNAHLDEGPWLPISPSHGIHIFYVAIVGLWIAATLGLLRLTRKPTSTS